MIIYEEMNQRQFNLWQTKTAPTIPKYALIISRAASLTLTARSSWRHHFFFKDVIVILISYSKLSVAPWLESREKTNPVLTRPVANRTLWFTKFQGNSFLNIKAIWSHKKSNTPRNLSSGSSGGCAQLG